MVGHHSVARPPELASGTATARFRPMLFDASSEEGLSELRALIASSKVNAVYDTIDDQLNELISCANPSVDHSTTSLAEARQRILGDTPAWRWGTWVFYPWRGELAHVLPRTSFHRVRTDRNRGKLDQPSQERLRERRIGVIGLSVGNSAALTLAMEGVGGSFRLADFDTVGLSNLNRLRAAVTDLGASKAVLAARQMYEIDPYLEIEVCPDGVTSQSIAAFFDGVNGDAPLDLLVEECDTVWVKLAAREFARRRGIPVLMDTNDRGMLDVERFDIEPLRPLLHGHVGALTSADVAQMSEQEQRSTLLSMVDERGLSQAMRDAIGAIGTSLSSWPQLASGVMLGGAVLTDTARRILLGEAVVSGRTYIDLDELIGAKSARLLEVIR
ncbi:ThiF family adenylyltransferase [Nocardia camponoti]|uniref:THIF-type NAD/FAD binding fold domain-containing protein n=1 Tax=Nocardia camponoti TaxID=1616106 RepID=A0A917Q9J9_9NOCA|nr:ThiF family adenylyltransferase [Nocardia camponoti]GGK36603.1 hypothetical protein GCM10011591_05300 [Nocardia camponoti]